MTETYDVQTRRGPVTVRSKDDVKRVFTNDSGFSIGDSIEETNISAMDCELDSVSGTITLRVHLYLTPLDAVRSASLPREKLQVENWTIEEFLLSNDSQHGVVYERPLS